MLPHSKKINTQLFKEIMLKGRNYNFDYFSTKFLKLPIGEKSRVTFVVSKKIEKKAVSRNLLRRKAFNIINDIYNNLPSSVAIIFFLKKTVVDLEIEDFKKEIIKVFEKLK